MGLQRDDSALSQRVESALQEAGVTVEHSKSLAVTLLGNETFYAVASNSVIGSHFFDFAGKIQTFVGRFSNRGLTVEKYLSAAAKQPSLFCQSPETIEHNIRDLVSRFAADGLTVEKYLSAAVKQPPLFCQSPETIAGHINLIGSVYRDELVRFRGSRQNCGPSLEPVLDFLCKNPVVLCLADNNLDLRSYSASWSAAHTASSVYTTRRSQIESEVAQHLGHDDLSIAVPSIERLEDGTVNPQDAGRWVLRAMIHAGLIKSGVVLDDEGPRRR